MSHLQELIESYLPKTYAKQGLDSIRSHEKVMEILLEHGKLPRHPWEESTIEFALNKFALMDSNNFPGNVGVGEREGRVFAPLVARRHFHLSHGIGRSGDIIEIQPKAAGSSLIYQLTNQLTKHALEIAGLDIPHLDCVVFPLATGMTLAMAMIALKSQSPPQRKYVLWPRIDQKSCFKSILTAGLIPIIVENILGEDGLKTDLVTLQRLLEERGEEILCVLSTTSCFAPRQPDLVDSIAKLCQQYHVGHVINNAYGLQCRSISKSISRACRVGRVDAIVQSTDKNFLVPVGGAIIASPPAGATLLKTVSASYPGRASMAPILDLFITLLTMGEQGYRDLLEKREKVIVPRVKQCMEGLMGRFGLSLIDSPRNSISFAYSLDTFSATNKPLSFLGAMLFQRNVSGCRVVSGGLQGVTSKISGYSFKTWGAHQESYPHSYFTLACAIGMEEEEISVFIGRLEKTLAKFIKINVSEGSLGQNSITEEQTEGEEQVNVSEKLG
eukprot:gene3861-4218_t